MDNVDQVVDVTPFGTWLIGQEKADAWWAALAKAAKADRGLPRGASPEQMLKRFQDHGADPEMFEMLEDAERAWIAAAA